MEEINKERWSRSVALEEDYVNQVYEKIGRDLKHAKDPLHSQVQNFLNGLEPGSAIADIGWSERDFPASLSVCRASPGGALPLRSGAFEGALSVGALHHLACRERRVQALRETARLLRVGGKVLIAVRSSQQQGSQDILMPWYDIKNEDESCSDEESEPDSLPDDEPSTPSSLDRQPTDHPPQEQPDSDSLLGVDAEALPKSLQSLLRDNCIELRNLDEREPKEPEEEEKNRRRSLTESFKTLWTSCTTSSPAAVPLKRSVTTATCTFHPPLESIREMEMTLGEADQIVNAFLATFHSPEEEESTPYEEDISTSELLQPPDTTGLLDSLEEAEEEESSQLLKVGHNNELSDTSAKQNFILPSSKIKSFFPDISERSMLQNTDSKIVSADGDALRGGESRHLVRQSNLKVSKLFGNSNDCFLKSKCNETAERCWSECSLNHEDKVSLSCQQKLIFVQKQLQNSDRPCKLLNVPNNCNLGRNFSGSTNCFIERTEIEEHKLAHSITFYSMPNLNESFWTHKLSYSIPPKKIENENMSYLKKRMLERISEKYPHILECFKSEVCISPDANLKNYQLNRSLTDIYLKSSSKNEFRNNCENNNASCEMFLSPSLSTSSSLTKTSLSNGLSKSFERLNIPLDKTAASKHKFPSHLTSSFKTHLDEAIKERPLEGTNDNTLDNLNNVGRFEHCGDYLNSSYSQPASLRLLNCPNKRNFSGRFNGPSVDQRSIPENVLATSCSGDETNEDPTSMMEDEANADSNSNYRNSAVSHLTQEKSSDTSYPDSSEELLSRNSFDSCQNTDVTKCISERNSERFRGCLQELKECRTPEKDEEENEPLVVNYSYGRIHDKGATVVMHRYYHLFEEDELKSLIEKYVSDLHILEYFEYQSHWCVIAEKVRVWTI